MTFVKRWVIAAPQQPQGACHVRILLAATLLTFALPAQAAVVINGSFELGAFTGAPFDTLSAGDTSITGWTIGGVGVDWIGSFWQPSEGARSLDLSATGAGSISQTLTTIIGNSYTVSFDLSGNPSGGPNPKDVDVSINGDAVSTYGYATGNNTAADMQWLTYTYSFIANSTSSILAFTSLADMPSGPALDNVRIEDLGGNIPEPATWVSMIAGFGLVGAVARRRRGAVAA